MLPAGFWWTGSGRTDRLDEPVMARGDRDEAIPTDPKQEIAWTYGLGITIKLRGLSRGSGNSAA